MNAKTVYKVAIVLPELERLSLYWMLERDFELNKKEFNSKQFITPSIEEMSMFFATLIRSKETILKQQ